MKRKRFRLLSLVLIACVLVTSTETAFATNKLSEDSDFAITENYYMDNYTGYVYPILPGTKKWRTLKNHQEMVDACQIPDEVYQKMGTNELAQSIIAYPLNADMFAYNSYEIGYSIVKEHFGALEEFSKRADSASCLINLYSQQELVNVSTLDDATLRAFNSEDAIATTGKGQKTSRQILNILVLDLLLSQDDFTEKMTLEDQNHLTDIVESRIVTINQMQELEIAGMTRNGSPSYFVNIFIGYIDSIYYSGKIAVDSTLIKTPKKGSMTGYTMEALEVWHYTDGNDRVRQLPDLSSAAKTSLNTQYYNIYGINPISGSGPTVKYNCHSYAWYKQTNCNYWVNTPNTNGYTLVDKLTVNIGGKMVYYASNDGSYTNLTHSAVITDIEYHPRSRVSFTVKSKWGMCGLYEHLWYNCPYYYHDANGNHNQYPNDIQLYNS